MAGKFDVPGALLDPGGTGADPSAPAWSGWVTVPHASILTLPTVGFDLVAAPGVNKIILPVLAVVTADVTAGNYTNIFEATASAFPHLYLGYADGGAASDFLYSNILLTDDSVPAPFAVFSIGHDIDYSLTDFPVLPKISGNPASYVNKALQFNADNNVNGDFTGGNAANFIKINVLRSILTLP